MLRKKDVPAPPPTARSGILVDADGNEVRGAWQPGRFYAQPPVAYHFGGTVPGYDPHRARPGDRMRTRIAYDQEEQANQALLKQAVFDLSQTKYGRQLLTKANDARTRIVFDQHSSKMKDADAVADYASNQVLVKPGHTRQEMMLNLSHELRHFELHAGGKGPSNGSESSLAATWSIVQAKEADARAVGEGIVAIQASRLQPGEDPRTYKPRGILDQFTDRWPVMASAAKGAASLVDQGNLADFAAAVFPAFYHEHATRAAYAHSVMAKLTAAAPRRSDSFDGSLDSIRHRERMAGFMVSDAGASHAELAPKLTVNGEAYMARSKFSLDSPEVRQLSNDPQVREHYRSFREDMAGLAEGSGYSPRTDVLLELPSRSLVDRLLNRIGSRVPQPAKRAVVAPPAAASFQVIAMPSPNGTDHVGDGRPALAALHRELPRSFAGASPIEALSSALYSIQERTDHARRTAQVQALVDMGLRAPIAAFPQTYLSDLMARVQGASEVKDRGTTRGIFTPGERELVKHWQDMQSRGIDPVFGGVAGKPALPGAIPGNDIVFANALVAQLPRLASQPAATPVTMALSDMVAAVRVADMAPQPDAGASVVKSRPASRR